MIMVRVVRMRKVRLMAKTMMTTVVVVVVVVMMMLVTTAMIMITKHAVVSIMQLALTVFNILTSIPAVR